MIKKLFTLGLLTLCTLAAKAQTAENDSVKHLTFMGIPIEGSIDSFKDSMEPKYKLKRKVGSENYFLFEGPMFGHNVYIQAYYSRKTRTPYRVVVSPKHLSLEVWQDSLISTFGDPVRTEQGLLWQRPEGMILHYTPEGYDTALIFLDSKGNEAFREEK